MEWDFKQHLSGNLGINPLQTVLLGFSGGPDSLCLLLLLVENGFQVVAGHLDHGLREKSAMEVIHAEKVCRSFGVEFVTRRADVAAHARQNHISVEESARVLRYEFLFEEANCRGAQAVLVAHNADDQVETVLMHLLRGSGLSGLAGMRAVLLPNPWSRRIPLVRPLIDISRSKIEAILVERGLTAIVDESNTDQQYFRNRIRHDLLPSLETYNPRIRERMLHMADVAATEDDFLRSSVEVVWNQTMIEQGERYLMFKREALLDFHPALLRRLVRRAIEWIDPELRDINFEVINRAASFCQCPTRSRRIDLLSSIEMFLYGSQLVFARVDDPLHVLWPQIDLESEIGIPVPGRLEISPYWLMQADRYEAAELESSPFIAYLDVNKLDGPLAIGRARPGERYAPYGLDGHTKKLGDFWNTEGVPARARKNWPLIRAGEQIVWVPGFRIAHHAQVDESTAIVIRLMMKKINRQ